MAASYNRANQMFAAIAAAMAIASLPERQGVLAKLGTYKSHGKGRGSSLGAGYDICVEKQGNRTIYVAKPISRSKYNPHQGKREMARRKWQQHRAAHGWFPYREADHRE